MARGDNNVHCIAVSKKQMDDFEARKKFFYELSYLWRTPVAKVTPWVGVTTACESGVLKVRFIF